MRVLAAVGLGIVLGTLDTPALAAQQAVSARAGAASQWAVVAADGSLERGSASVVSTERLAPGEFAVVFDRRVGGCAFNASPETANPAFVATARLAGNSAGVLVRLWDERRPP
jgi:hypothetical protein